MADVLGPEPSVRKGVRVQVPPPTLKNPYGGKGSEAAKPGFVITLSSQGTDQRIISSESCREVDFSPDRSHTAMKSFRGKTPQAPFSASPGLVRSLSSWIPAARRWHPRRDEERRHQEVLKSAEAGNRWASGRLTQRSLLLSYPATALALAESAATATEALPASFGHDDTGSGTDGDRERCDRPEMAS